MRARLPALLGAALALTAGPALAGGASTAAVHAATCPPEGSVTRPLPTGAPTARAEFVNGDYAVVGIVCGSSFTTSMLMHRAASVWTLVSELPDWQNQLDKSDPFSLRGVPAQAAAALWKAFQANGAGQFPGPPSRADIAAVRDAENRVGDATVKSASVVGPWALLTIEFKAPQEGGGQTLYHKMGGGWSQIASEGGAMEPMVLWIWGVPYDIGMRLQKGL
jgi:hypothetical protein